MRWCFSIVLFFSLRVKVNLKKKAKDQRRLTAAGRSPQFIHYNHVTWGKKRTWLYECTVEKHASPRKQKQRGSRETTLPSTSAFQINTKMTRNRIKTKVINKQNTNKSLPEMK